MLPTFLQNHSKLVAAIVGNLVGILAVWLATKGLATCVADPTPGADGELCTVMGFSTADMTTYAMLGINALFVWASAANKPPA